jgi:cation-transporting ATPase E
MMIGDGVNDLPGLKQANVGFCMGSGSQLAMTVSDITLKKNDLTVVYKAVTVGVRLQQNYLKLVNFMLPGTLMHFIFQIIDNMTELPAPPVTLFMSLMYNLVFATINCLSICVSDVEQDKPKGIIASPYYWFFGMGLFQTVAAYITYFSVLNDYGIKPATAWTI